MNRLTNQVMSLVLLLLTTCSVVAQTPVQVEIESVDVRNNSISVTHNGKTRKLAIAPNAEITLEDKKADLVSLLPGNSASIVYDKNLAAVTSIAAQRTAILPAEKLAEGWDEIDDRLIFLMVRLASTEASLEAIDNALAASNRNQSRKSGQARQAENKNTDMDRKGGGPLKWSLFYGRTAESFFYHPTDRNSTYHTVTILSQQSPTNDNQTGPGVPSRQGLPVHQRPPQFDYIYRANESAKARAEKDIAALVGKTAELSERKHRLETEQAGLWCEIAFRSVSHYDLDRKPLYRFEPILRTASDTDARVQFETARSAASFMALALSIVDAAQKDQQATFSKMKPAITKARQDMNDAWLRIGVDVTDRKSVEGRFHALAKKLEESASNLSDSYVVAMEGDMAKDQQRKDTFRGLLQESLIRYAEIILALDEMATLMKDDWQIKPDIDKPIQFVKLEQTEASLGGSNLAGTSDSNAKPFLPLEGNDLRHWESSVSGDDFSNWQVTNGVLKLTKVGQSLKTRDVFRDFDLHLEFKLPPRNNSGVFLRGRYEVQLLDSLFRKQNGESAAPLEQCGAIYGQYAPSKDVYKGSNQWNSLDVRLVGYRVTVRMNNVTIIDGKTLSKVTGGALDENESDPGPIVLHAHATTGQEFRNISVTPIVPNAR